MEIVLLVVLHLSVCAIQPVPRVSEFQCLVTISSITISTPYHHHCMFIKSSEEYLVAALVSVDKRTRYVKLCYMSDPGDEDSL